MSTGSNQPTASQAPDRCEAVVLVSASSEWRAVRTFFPASAPQSSPFGEWLAVSLEVAGRAAPIVFVQGGWGKIDAAARQGSCDEALPLAAAQHAGRFQVDLAQPTQPVKGLGIAKGARPPGKKS